jgi:hypothetical protein
MRGHVSLDNAPAGKDLLESDIQHRTMDRARSRKCYVRKMVSIAYKGFPDIIICRGGMILFMEVKTVKGTVTKMQEMEHKKLREAGATIVVTRGLSEAYAAIDLYFPELEPDYPE